MLNNSISIRVKSILIGLLPEKGLWLEDQQVLILSDLHFGKIQHFRKTGIPLPEESEDKAIERLIYLVQKLSPRSVWFLGDLFHSHYNHQWEIFGQVIKAFPNTKFTLIDGNHDILSDYQYDKFNIARVREKTIGPLLFSHEPITTDAYNIHGHLHPGITLKGKGKQHLKLPAFIFKETSALVPAFGDFTGAVKVKTSPKDRVFAVADNRVINIK